MRLFSIKDVKVGSFTGAFVFPSAAIAARTLGSQAQRDSVLSAYPEDFDVYDLGGIDLETGIITPSVTFAFHLKGALPHGGDSKSD